MSSTTDPGDKTPEQIEREVEQTRNNVSETLDELRNKLQPSRMMDDVVGEAVEWVKGSGGTDFARNLGVTIRDNPLPVALIGAGVLWLMLGGSRKADAAGYRREMAAWDEDGSYGTSRHGDATPRYRGEGSVSYAADSRSTLDTVKEKASEVASTVADAASRAASAVGEAASGATEMGKRQFAAIGDQAGVMGDRAVAQAREAEPFLYGALGLAIGAGIGSLLPATAAENRLMGEHRDAAVGALRQGYDTVRHVAEDKLTEARETLVETYEGTMQRLDREGLSEAPRILGDAASKLGEQTQDTLRSAADEAKRKLGG